MDEKKLRAYQKEAKNPEDSLVQRGLSKIYSNKDGSLPDISHLEVDRKSRTKFITLIAAGIVVLLSVIAWLGFIIFNPNYQFRDHSINLEISGPKNIASGDEVEYTLTYKNLEKVQLSNTELLIRYPDGFEFSEASPTATNEFNSSWKVGDLARNQGGEIKFKGRLIGEVGSLKSFHVTASFEPENFSSSFKETYTYNTQITSSILQMDVTGPEKTLPEKKSEYKIVYRNTSNRTLDNVRIVATYPENFIFQESQPAPFSREDDARKFNNQWAFDSLGAGQEGEIVINGGYIAPTDNQPALMKLQIGFYDPETQLFSVQQEKIVTTTIIKHDLTVDLIVNGNSQNQPVAFDQTLNYSIVVKNQGTYELTDLKIEMAIDSQVVDWNQLVDKHNGSRAGSTITWNKENTVTLAMIRPGENVSIDFTLPIKSAGAVNVSTANLQTVSQATVSIGAIGDMQTLDVKVQSQSIIHNVNTDLQLRVEGRYFDDDNIAVGTGPLPPVVGQRTTFRVYWSIANSVHAVDDATVSVRLPDGVEWADKFLVKKGKISYSSATRTVSWEVDRVAANQTFDQVYAWFDVAVTPTASQAGTLLILTDQAQLIASDVDTNEVVVRSGKSITSNLDDDPIGGGRGVVIDIAD